LCMYRVGMKVERCGEDSTLLYILSADGNQLKFYLEIFSQM
jgi:hypothetical protein